MRRVRSSEKRKTGNLYAADCPSRRVLDTLTSRWGSLVLVLLLERKHRFSELARRIGGVSDKMLAQSLRALEKGGFVDRTVFDTKPPMVEYSLTALGREAASHIHALTRWVEGNISAVLEKQGL